jgi:hypothetical protein
MKKRVFLVVVGLLLASLTASATITTYTDLALWQSAVGAVVVEPFSPLCCTTWITDAGSIGAPQSGGFLSGTVWRGNLTSTNETTFTYAPGGVPTALKAVAGNWDTVPNSQGSGIFIELNLSGGGTQLVVSSLNTTALSNSFFGWTSTVPFTSFRMYTQQVGGITAEHFDVDDVRYATVLLPEPATFVLIGSALLGLGLLRRRKK